MVGVRRMLLSVLVYFLLDGYDVTSAQDEQCQVDFEQVSAIVEGNSIGYLILDVRSFAEVEDLGKIPYAEVVPVEQLEKAFALPAPGFRARYGFEKPALGDPIVTYCRSGRRAANAANILIGLGYQNVCVYGGSFNEWSALYQGQCQVNFEEVNAIVEGNSIGYLILDVRSFAEVDDLGKIPYAEVVPVEELATAFTLPAPAFRAQYGFEKPALGDPIVTYCRSGRRAGIAADILVGLRYQNVCVYGGSFNEWSALYQG